MKKNFSLLLLIVVLFLFGCKKSATDDLCISPKLLNSQNEKEHGASARAEVDPEMVEKMLLDTNFLHLVKVIEDIAIINDTVDRVLDEATLPDFIEALNTRETDSEALDHFEETGIQNSPELFALFTQIHPLVFKIFSEEEAFQDFLDEDALPLLEVAIYKYFEETPILHFRQQNNDECSDTYALGMSNCDDVFALGVGTTFLSTILITIGSGGIGVFGVGMTISGGIAASYASLYVCQTGVTSAWRICRRYHPLP